MNTYKFTDNKTGAVSYYRETGKSHHTHGEQYQEVDLAGNKIGRASYLAQPVTQYGKWELVPQAAVLTQRTAVTAQWLLEHPDVNGYIYNKERDEAGLDAWTWIGGIDRLTKTGQIVLEYGRLSDKVVAPDFIVYVAVKDYLPFAAQPAPAPVKPKVQLSGTDGNVFALLGKCSRALKAVGQAKQAEELYERTTKAQSYDEALQIMQEYVDAY
jgi:hypothetical protein